ncbi:MAG: DUF4968 domain-containing protein, partial [Acidipropionibacterium jensenii]|nr:DUF4968 domain-containing protein [Acidipropionibacterium jensenii]
MSCDPARPDPLLPNSLLPSSLLQGEHYRLTPLTPRVIRLEWSPSGRFEDRPTTFAVHRDLPAVDHRVKETGTGVRVTTDFFILDYDRGPFSTHGLSAEVRGGVSDYHSVWRYRQDLSLPADRRMQAEGRAGRGRLDGNMGG